jgi:hypothetical protein
MLEPRDTLAAAPTVNAQPENHNMS